MDKSGRAWNSNVSNGQVVHLMYCQEALTVTRFYTLEEIARELHIAPATVRNRLTLRQPMPPSIRIGRRRLFPVDEFERWIASQMTRSDADETSLVDGAPLPDISVSRCTSTRES
ncbi:helix-turn-helix domain-containing protein [Caballeronia sp. LZ001]|uniref:helix-turn-helix domain-containing protein n=1 Tax=Caballeronia sp. LZ001 TaxID=3038553 RepID=UPI00285AF98C|nr:helix-turn-helix domain-containing protein [Caballeronia sp. LZ001]MDR5804896.1 helix-turn-helix domain-containing protein [Caballeronia sp. LZ001]